MGVTNLKLYIANPRSPQKREGVEFLVDSGAIYSVVPETILKKLDVKPHSIEEFRLADGTTIKRRRGDAVFFYDGKQGASPVVFGKKGDGVLLGAVTLESLGFVLDPIRRRLRDLPMLLV